MIITTTVRDRFGINHRLNSATRSALMGLCLSASVLAGCGDILGGNGSDGGAVAATGANDSESYIKAAVEGRTGADSPDAAGAAGAAGAPGSAGSAASAASAGSTGSNGSASPTAAAPAGAAQPAPAAPAPAGSTINTLDTIVNDMKLNNDLKLAGISGTSGWATGPGQVIMGNDPRGTHTPSWWSVYNTYYKSSAYWNAILPWFVVFDGVGNGASNTRVQLRNLVLYIKSKSTGQWNLARRSVGVGGELYPKTLQGSQVWSPDVRNEADGSTSVLPPGGNLVYHGWGSKDDLNGADVGAILISMQARLIKNNPSGTDDRAQAKYLLHVGGDYYPERSTRLSDMAPGNFIPGIGVSRAKLVTSEWQAFNFSTIDVGVEDPGGGVITEAQFRAAPPPLE